MEEEPGTQGLYRGSSFWGGGEVGERGGHAFSLGFIYTYM